MTEWIAILGGNGVYARHLIPRLIGGGHRVIALVRRPDAAGFARSCGADVRIADIFDAGSLAAGLADCSIGINLATSLPGPSGRGDFEANDRVRAEGAANWVAACVASGVSRVIQQSIGMICASGDNRWTDESYVFPATPDTVTGRAFLATQAMEQIITTSPLDWIILRGGLFYGPGTGFDDGWIGRAAAGKLKLPGDGGAYVSLCHIEDMAAATVAAVERWPSRETLIVCDDAPATWTDVFGHVAAIAGGPAPSPGGLMGFPSFRLRNDRAKEKLHWRPFYRSYHMGLAR
ncbi:MAG TPA: NAD(P)-dependent oxidoreductase [Hyphomonadaceae bacterium]|jgi:nucleoside-diphosphate-sugar epimerase|nr:NAD(P)-dependent oxidoreductase [Hyphomonadaceae bacterium]